MLAETSDDQGAAWGLAVVPTLVAMDLVVFLRRSVIHHNCPGALVLDMQRTFRYPDIPHLAPELSPGVADVPVEALLRVCAPANDRDGMVDARALRRDDPRLIVQEWARINATSNGAAYIDLLHHRVLARDGTVLEDGGIRVPLQACAWPTLLREAPARARNVNRLASGVDVLAKTLLGIRAARQVGLGCLVTDTGTFLGNTVEPLVGPINGTPVAGADTSTIHQVLDRWGDVHTLSTTSDLDPVSERRHRAVGPAGTAVLGDVLIPGDRAIIHTSCVAPRERCREVLGLPKQIMGVRGVPTPHNTQGLCLFLAQDLAAALFGSGRHGVTPEDSRGKSLSILFREARARHCRGCAPHTAAARLRVRVAAARCVVRCFTRVVLGETGAEQHRSEDNDFHHQ